MRIIMTMVYDIIIVSFLQNAVMTRSVHCTVGRRLQNCTSICIRSKRSYRARSVLHMIGTVMTRIGRIHKIIDTVSFHHKRSFKEILYFRIRNQLCFHKTFHIRCHLSSPAAKTFIDTPCTPIQIYRTVIVYKRLAIQRNGILHKTIGNQHGFTFSQYILPWATRCICNSFIYIARLAIEHTIRAIGMLHYIRGPNPVAVRPVHRHDGPVLKILATPYLRRTKSCPTAISRSIDIICISELLYRRVCKIPWNKRIPRTWSIPFHLL